MKLLREKIEELLKKTSLTKDIKNFCKDKTHALPFNYCECIISHLLTEKVISIQEYKTILDEYDKRNPYLFLFEKFGVALENWILDEILMKKIPSIQKPDKSLDAGYKKRKYDLFLEPNIKIEVKTSRAVKHRSKLPLYEKALSLTSSENFDMNFQQLKPDFCDVFLFALIWRDEIQFLVLSSSDVSKARDYSSKQHAGKDEDFAEGQLHIKRNNLSDFNDYLSPLDKIEESIRKAFEREQNLRRII